MEDFSASLRLCAKNEKNLFIQSIVRTFFALFREFRRLIPETTQKIITYYALHSRHHGTINFSNRK